MIMAWITPKTDWKADDAKMDTMYEECMKFTPVPDGD